MLAAKLSLFTLTHTLMKCKPLYFSDGRENGEERIRKVSLKVFKLTLMLPLHTVITLSYKTHAQEPKLMNL